MGLVTTVGEMEGSASPVGIEMMYRQCETMGRVDINEGRLKDSTNKGEIVTAVRCLRLSVS